MDSSKTKNRADDEDASAPLLELEAGAGGQPQAEPRTAEGYRALLRRFINGGGPRVACECVVLVAIFYLSTYGVIEGPWRRQRLALAYAAVAVFLWVGRWLSPGPGPGPDWRAQWLKIAAFAIAGVLEYFLWVSSHVCSS